MRGQIDEKQLLAEVEELIRSAPTSHTQAPSRHEWLGHASAVLKESLQTSSAVDSYLDDLGFGGYLTERQATSYGRIIVSLYQARRALQWSTGTPTGVVIEQGMQFDYFDRVRKIIEQARDEILFVDPYMGPEFVSKYMRLIGSNVKVRLLTSVDANSLAIALSFLAKQSKIGAEIRLSKQLHDRFIFVDQKACYMSGASFKDGAKRSPTIIAQITDGFDALFGCYQEIWRASEKLSLPNLEP